MHAKPMSINITWGRVVPTFHTWFRRCIAVLLGCSKSSRQCNHSYILLTYLLTVCVVKDDCASQP